ncbi:5'/3'-nucleotidase SurE [Gordonia sp. 852002-10350_SCH5691597]|uniref:5'/3'-nucleotidase SurE n=1 Tax=Gordonia sp. 852002-10350_SCH5691597 TaxID=1834085 RepID=UPI0007EA1335|nr:5'/3'-nucleotidase SurE [Gordonia sp. 852002-10350_SCH5691597]OBA70920.1 5'/3'-nucleotidase SurE [Gordonia sp. 852002-10350_SCH5691597]
MRVLVTNDDGVDAEGLVAVATVLVDDGHDVVVAAPTTERSGSGSSIGTIEHGTHIAVQERHIDALGTTPVFAVDCPPALAVIAACAGAFGPAPELVVSGINPGHNTGRSILFSSTVGGILAARVTGVSGVAISTAFEPHHRYDTAAAVARSVVRWMSDRGSPRLTLNVNVPAVDLADLDHAVITTLAAQSMFSLRISRTENDLVLHREERDGGFRPGTDGAAVVDGHVSITSLNTVADANGVLSEADARELARALDLTPTSI